MSAGDLPDEGEDRDTASPGVRLPDGESFQPPDSVEVMGARRTKWIGFGGPHRSGKSSLIASIYERLVRRGPVGNHEFVWSKSLVAFERLSYLGRLRSGGAAPEMPRTSRQDGRPMYHLALRGHRGECDFLFCDIAGETFDDYYEGAGDPEEHKFLAKADAFVYLLDGAKLASLEERQSARDRARTTVRKMIEQDAWPASVPVQIVVAKSDCIDTGGALAHAFASDAAMRVEREAGGDCTGPYFVSARDPLGDSIHATGIDSLLRVWFELPWRHRGPGVAPQRPAVSIAREINRFNHAPGRG